MAFTTSIRFATTADADFAQSAAAAAGLLWDRQTMRSYYEDADNLIGVGEIQWPEQGIANKTPCALLMGRKRTATVCEILLLAIDPATLPDVPANATRRRTLVDRLLRGGLEALVARGFTTGFAKVPKGSKMEAYVDSISGVTRIDDPDATAVRHRYSMNLAQAITFLQTRSG